jgi:CheY-like chemotaxis protein
VTEGSLRDRNILVVEDDYLVAQILIDFLEEAGVTIVGPIGWVEEAVALIEADASQIDAAILDVNLHGSRSYPVADALTGRSIPFVFATGYGAEALDGAYRSHRRCEKPFNQTVLMSALEQLFR